MRLLADVTLQAKLLKDIQDLHRKRTELEVHIRNLDALVLSKINQAALREIAAYKADLARPQLNLF